MPRDDEIKKLHSEIDNLKSTLFDVRLQQQQQQQAETSGGGGSSSYRDLEKEKEQTREREKEARSSNQRRSGKVAGDETSEMILVNRLDFERMKKDLELQETLIGGLQRENEKLFNMKKERDDAEKAAKAHFFDQQELMNKELNRLRNMTQRGGNEEERENEDMDGVVGVGVGMGSTAHMWQHPRRSGEVLRAELDADVTVRALRERVAIAESNAGAREKELQVSIDKLRRENRELIEASARLRKQVLAEVAGDIQQQETSRQRLVSEIEELKVRLVWYVENQELLEAGENVKESLRRQVGALKRELRRFGVSAGAVESILASSSSSGSCISPRLVAP